MVDVFFGILPTVGGEMPPSNPGQLTDAGEPGTVSSIGAGVFGGPRPIYGWWNLDLGQRAYVQSVRVAGYGGTGPLSLETSVDGITYTEVVSAATLAAANGAITPVGATSRYWRLKYNGYVNGGLAYVGGVDTYYLRSTEDSAFIPIPPPITYIGDAVVNPLADWRLLIKEMGGLGNKFVATGPDWKTRDINWAGGAVYTEPAAGAWRIVGFNDTAWDYAYVPKGADYNSSWTPIGGAQAISGQAKAEGRINGMVWLSRKEFTIATAATQDGIFEYNGDNSFEVWLDNVPLTLSTDTELLPGQPFKGSQSITIPMAMLGAGTHCLAVKTTNLNLATEWRNTWEKNPTMFQGILTYLRSPNSKLQLTINSTTKRYRQDASGIIRNDQPRFTMPAGGPYSVVVVQVPEDPIHNTGGTFYKMTTGPYVGWLINKWTNASTLGDITVSILNTFDRGPGQTVATIHRPAAHQAGASLNYNAAGELHFTLLVDDPNILKPKPKQTHYAVEFARPLTTPFAVAASDTFTRKEHGLLTGSVVEFDTLTGGAGLLKHKQYYVIASGLTANEFKLSETSGGSAVNFTTDITSASYWHEVFAGLVWDIDATDTETVFYGVDYLGLLRYTVDERFNPKAVDRSAALGGSKYINSAISTIVTDHLNYSISQPHSLVGFIGVGGISTMASQVTIFSTLQDSLKFITGLIDSHRAGTGKWTRLKVVKQGPSYFFTVIDDPGINRPGLTLEYGALAQGYRIIPFGVDWASRVNVTGQSRLGNALLYKAESSAVDQGQWGSIALGGTTIESEDENDLRRRAMQAAIDASRFGKQISVGLKLGSFSPLDGYDLNDAVPVLINHGAVTTREWGNDDFNSMVAPGVEDSGVPLGVMAAYWSITGLTWETFDDGHWVTNLTLFPEGRRQVDPASIPTTSSVPVPRSPVAGGNGAPPVGENPTNVNTYTDRTTGQAYTWSDDTSTWTATGSAGPAIIPPFVFTQLAALATWNIPHNMGKYPSVSVVDTGKNIVYGDVLYVDINNVTVTFSVAFSGYAYLN